MIENINASLLETMNIGDKERLARLKYIDLTGEDISLLKSLKPSVEKKANDIVDGFYDTVKTAPELIDVIDNAGSTIDRLKLTQKKYLLELFDGQYDRDYFERRLRIGVIHNHIGLSPRWYLGMYSVYSRLLTPVIFRRYWFNPLKFIKALCAVNKILSLDSQLAMDTYIHGLVDDVKNVSLSKEEIETKVLHYKKFISQVAEGSLNQQLEISGHDDLAILGEQINAMVKSLSGITTHIIDASDSIVSMIGKLKSAVAAQSSGASEQAAAINQTSSSLEQIKATSQQTQEKAQALGNMANQIRTEGRQGNDSIVQVINAMNGIRSDVNGIANTMLALNEKTQQIGNIVSVVSNLAQSSKMLALNASIEAAKAGEAGKGFAIVAVEVRELADQSQQSTEQIQKILKDISQASDRAVMAMEQGIKGVDYGEQLVKQSGKIIEQLNAVIHEAVIASQQIVAAVRQEGAGISQVAVAMNQINAVTGQFVIASGETKSVAEELSLIAGRLQESVSVYKA